MLGCLGCQLGALRLHRVISHSFRKSWFNALYALKGITAGRGNKATKQESVAWKKWVFMPYQEESEIFCPFSGVKTETPTSQIVNHQEAELTYRNVLAFQTLVPESHSLNWGSKSLHPDEACDTRASTWQKDVSDVGIYSTPTSTHAHPWVCTVFKDQWAWARQGK